MEDLIKEDKSKKRLEFEKLLEQDLEKRAFQEGKIIQGTITKVDSKYIFIDTGLKAEGAIPVEEMDKIPKVGETVEVLLERLENFSGDLVISRQAAVKHKAWGRMEKAFDNQEVVEGMIISRVKGGWAVNVDSCMCFLPSSQVALQPLKNIDHLMREKQKFLCVKMDRKRGNIVLSRREILSRERNKSKEEILSKLHVGQIIENATVKAILDYGIFLDLDGQIDSLCHVTSLSWSRVSHPSELVTVGEKLTVKIIKIEDGKVHSSIKDLTEDPYLNKIKKYEVGKIYKGTVSKVTQYGAFCILESGLEGLIHSSELQFSQKKNISPREILSPSQKISVKILEITTEKRRISLSYKKAMPNPYEEFAKEHPISSDVEGAVVKNMDFGIFVTVKNYNIQCLIHWKDLHWDEDQARLKKFSIGDTIAAKVMEVSPSQEKIRLSAKHTKNDPFNFFKDNKLKVGNVITVVVKETSDSGIKVSVGNDGLTSVIKKGQIALDKQDARPSRFSRGDKIDSLITELNFSKRQISLSIKALEEKERAEAVKKYGSQDSGASLSEILGPVLKNKKK